MAGDSWCAEDRVVGLTCGSTVGWSLAWLWLTLCQVSRQHDQVAVALDRLRAEDAHAAGDAEAALGPLTWGEGLETVTLHGLQRFLWYELPRKWITDLDGKRHIAIALGRLLELLGLRATPRSADHRRPARSWRPTNTAAGTASLRSSAPSNARGSPHRICPS